MSGDKQAVIEPARQPQSGAGNADSSPGAAPPPASDVRRALAGMTLESFVRAVAIAGMLTCIMVALSQLIGATAPTWPSAFSAALVFLVSLESITAAYALTRIPREQQNRWRFRFVEITMILLAVRFGIYLPFGVGRLLHDVEAWTVNLWSFFDVYFVVLGVLAIGVWLLSSSLAGSMRELETTALEHKLSATDPNSYLRSTMPGQGRTDRKARLNRVVAIYFWGGVVLLLLTAFARVDVRKLILLQHPRSSGIILNALIYFLLGLMLISQAQYTILRANWELQEIPLLGKLGKRWILLVIGFLLLVGLIATLLPVGYSVGLLDAMGSVIQWAVYLVTQVAFGVLFLVAGLIGLIVSLLGGKQSTAPQRSAPMSPPPPFTAAPPGTPAAWWPLARSILFWLVLTAVIVYTVYHFAVDRWGLFRGLSLGRFGRWVRRAWRKVWRSTRRVTARLVEQISERLAARRARMAQRAWRYLAVGRLAPRERVRYFYLAALHRSTQLGYRRPPGMTPLQYEPLLADQVPDAREQVRELTRAFVEARYSEHSVSREDANGVQALWQQVKKALNVRRRGKEEVKGSRPD